MFPKSQGKVCGSTRDYRSMQHSDMSTSGLWKHLITNTKIYLTVSFQETIQMAKPSESLQPCVMKLLLSTVQ